MADKKELKLEETEKVSGGSVEMPYGPCGINPMFVSPQEINFGDGDKKDGNENTLNQNNNENNQGIQSNQQGGSGTQKNVQSIQTQGDVKL